jgi:23S rRNA (cytidine1920-2'-O)/16S rRNA (cytidine1409-2'-O)-methyltransferase
LNHFALDVAGMTAIDVGSSTGGFTDVLLSRGAERVYAVDSGTNQLAWRLRQDERVIVHE